MSKGLEQLLARIIENPTRMMIDRYLSLLVDLSEDEGKTSRALDLAEGLIRVDALQALRIAFMVHQTKPDDLRAYDLMIEGLNNRGRHAKAEVLRLERVRLVEALAAGADGRLSVVDTRSGLDPDEDLESVDELSEVSLNSSPSALVDFNEVEVVTPAACAEVAPPPMDGLAGLEMEIGGASSEPASLPYAVGPLRDSTAEPVPHHAVPGAAAYAPDLFEWQGVTPADAVAATWDLTPNEHSSPSSSPSAQPPRDEMQLVAPAREDQADNVRPAPVSLTRLLEIGGLGVGAGPAAAEPASEALAQPLVTMTGVMLEAPADEGEQPLFQLKSVGPIAQPPSLRVTVATPMVVSQAARFDRPAGPEAASDFADELASFAVQPLPQDTWEPRRPAPVPRIDVTTDPNCLAALPAPSSAQQQAAYSPRPAAAQTPPETSTGPSSVGVSLNSSGPSPLSPMPEAAPPPVLTPTPVEPSAPVATYSPNPGQKTTLVSAAPKRKAGQATTVAVADSPKAAGKAGEFASTPRTKITRLKSATKPKPVKPVPASGLSQFWSSLVGAFGHLEAKPGEVQPWSQGPAKSRQRQLEPLPEGFWRALAAIPQEQLTETDRDQNLQILADILTAELDNTSANAFAALIEHLQLSRENPIFWGLHLDTLVLCGMQRKALVEIRTLLNQRPQPVWAAVAWPRLPLIWQGLAVHGFAWREEAGVMALIKGLERRPPPKTWGLVV